MASSLHLCVFLCLASGLWAGVKANPVCPDDWEQHGMSCYMYNEHPLTWFEAEEACLHHHAGLVSIHSHEKHEDVMNFVGSNTDETTTVWLGGIFHPDGEWVWSDATPFLQHEGGEKLPEVPNGCLDMDHSGEVTVADCDHRKAYICIIHMM